MVRINIYDINMDIYIYIYYVKICNIGYTLNIGYQQFVANISGNVSDKHVM